MGVPSSGTFTGGGRCRAWLDAAARRDRGQTFTMGDIPVGVSIQRWFRMDIERENLPNLAAYYKRLQERPVYR